MYNCDFFSHIVLLNMIIVELLVYGWWDSDAAAFPDEGDGGIESAKLDAARQLPSFPSNCKVPNSWLLCCPKNIGTYTCDQ
jgi:hypothetical protein